MSLTVGPLVYQLRPASRTFILFSPGMLCAAYHQTDPVGVDSALATADEGVASRRRVPRFFLALGATILVVALFLFPLATWFLLDWRSDPGIRWVHELRLRKHQAARDVASHPRLLVEGGSSGFFSVDTELLSARLGLPAVNLATSAGMGLHELLQDAREVAQPGDTVLLYLELPLLSRGMLPLAEEERKYLWTYRPRHLLELPWREVLRQVYGNPWSDYTEGWQRREEGLAAVEPSTEWKGYNPVELSPSGDARFDELSISIPLKAATKRFPGVNEEAAAMLDAFLTWCGERHVAVIAACPSSLRGDHGGATAAEAYREVSGFYQARNVPWVDTRDCYQLPRELMADTTLHANDAGRRVITEVLARRLPSLLHQPPSAGEANLLVGSSRLGLARDRKLTGLGFKACYYVSEVDLRHPLCLTPATVKDRLAAGERFVFSDPEAADVLERAGVQSRVAEQEVATLASWWERYPRHLFALAAVGSWDTTALVTAAPDSMRAFLAGPGPAKAAVLSTAPTWPVAVLRSGSEAAEVEIPATHPALHSARLPIPVAARSGLELDRRASDPAIVAGHHAAVHGREAGLAVAIVDPDSGRVVREALFTGPELTTWELRELVPPAR